MSLKTSLSVFAHVFAISLVFLSVTATACGTHPPDEQGKIDAAELSALRSMALRAAREADRILIGTVTGLADPANESGGLGSVTLSVQDTLKGQNSEHLRVRWKPRFIYSCQPSEMFRNVGFRLHGKYIVYIRDGDVFRSDAADDLRSGLLSLDEEKRTASASNEQASG